MDRKSALSKLRSIMADSSIDAIIIPSNDNHFGEYVPPYYQIRAWLSGFTGSAGTLVVTKYESALWTDSRYFVQAYSQLSASEIQLFKQKMPCTPTVEQWILSQCKQQSTVAVDGDLYSYNDFISLKQNLTGLNVISIGDIFNSLWLNRPKIDFNEISLMEEQYSGESVISKHNKIVEHFSKYGDFAYIVSSCDSVMWLCNIRGCDIEYNSIALSYALITAQHIYLFVSTEALDDKVRIYLNSQNVIILSYDTFSSFLSKISPDVIRISNLSELSYSKYLDAGGANVKWIDDSLDKGLIAHLKSRKNEVEASGFRRSFVIDGIAWCKLLKYIDDNLGKNELNEYDIACKFAEYRAESPNYKGESFSPIVAFNANAAAPHYCVESREDATIIGNDGFLLMDTGAHYSFGTTDTTRTIAIGSLSQTQIDDYTLILKGMIQLSMAKFPKGTRGAQLDILARGPIFSAGKMYYHGTGHGIGHCLCVHESPQIRMEESPIMLDKGIVISDEPGVYLESQYGIRIENVLLVKDYIHTDIDFFEFETLTCVPIETKCINKQLLGEQCCNWLNNYHEMIKDKLSAYLDSETREWLLGKTVRI